MTPQQLTELKEQIKAEIIGEIALAKTEKKFGFLLVNAWRKK
jgi:hypothetical protein